LAKKNKRKSRSEEQFEYDPPFEIEEQMEPPKVKYKQVLAYLIDQDEVNMLVEASYSEYVEPPGSIVNTNYLTYIEEECVALIDGNFHPRKSKKKK